MKGDHTDRWSWVDGEKVGSDALDYESLLADGARKACTNEAFQFDRYCHQYAAKKVPKYADYTVDGSCLAWEACEEDDDGNLTDCEPTR